jgi:methionine synthase I (cobalamin-dependent)
MNKKAIQDQLNSKILLLDGAMGTMLQRILAGNNSRAAMNIYH